MLSIPRASKCPSLPPFVSQEIEKARKKMVEAEQEMKLRTMSSSTDFLTTIYIGNRQGDSLGMKVWTVDDITKAALFFGNLGMYKASALQKKPSNSRKKLSSLRHSSAANKCWKIKCSESRDQFNDRIKGFIPC